MEFPCVVSEVRENEVWKVGGGQLKTVAWILSG